MEQITSYKKLEKFPFEDIREVGSLFFYEESLCSLLISSHGLFVIRWVELDENTNLSRWMLFKIDFETCVQYVDNKISSLKLVESTIDNKVLLLDIDENSNYANILEIAPNNIPKSYLPDASAMFVSSYCPDIEKIKQLIQFNTQPYQLKPTTLKSQSSIKTTKIKYKNHYLHNYNKTQYAR
jgi:hypothetical protein